MQVKTKAIVISTTKFQEKSLVVKCFTESDGLRTYFVRDAFSKSKTAQKIAFFQPLTIIEIEANHKNNGNLEYFKEVRLSTAYSSINSNVIKSTIALFLSEVLQNSIQEEEKNESMFTFLETALIWFDTHSEVSNFHLILILELTKYLGFYPDISGVNLPFFEMTEGVFSQFHAISCLSEHETRLLKKLISLKFENDQKNFNVAERQLLIKILLEYYTYHISSFKKPRSVDILKEVFS